MPLAAREWLLACPGATALAMALWSNGCTPWPCVDTTVATSSSPDAAFSTSVVHRDCGAMGEVGARFNIRQADDRGTEVLFSLVGPFTATFVWEQPRVLRVVVGYGTKDDPAAWPEIEKQIEPYRNLRYRDVRIRAGTSRQFVPPPG